MTLPEADHLSALEQVCRRKGWKLLLRSSGLKTHVRDESVSELTFLDVVDKERDLVRRIRIEGGLVCEAAAVILESLREEAA